MTITKPPLMTSEGAIKMQLGVAAQTIGVDPASKLNYSRQNELTVCLETDTFNLSVVAKHLHALILHDYPNADTLNLTDEQFILAGSRYNRGTARPLADTSNHWETWLEVPAANIHRKYTSYGRAMMGHRPHARALLGMP